MDRTSLLAFLLIAVIIFLMPEYYKLVYPPTPDTDSLIVGIVEKIEELPLPDLNIETSPPLINKKSPQGLSLCALIYTPLKSALPTVALSLLLCSIIMRLMIQKELS